MPDPLQPFTPGDISPFVTSAKTVNTSLDLLRRLRDRKNGPQGSPPVINNPFVPATLVYVRPVSTTPIWGVVTPTGLLIDPDTATPADINASRTPAFTVGPPAAATDAVFILIEPGTPGRLSRAVASGTAVVEVVVTDASHRYAKPLPGSVFQMASAVAGPARLLSPAGVGSYKTLVLLGAPPPLDLDTETISVDVVTSVCPTISSGVVVGLSVEMKTITVVGLPGTAVSDPFCVEPAECCPTTIACTACAGSTLPERIYLTGIDGSCRDFLHGSTFGPIGFNSATGEWSHANSCVSIGTETYSGICLTSFKLRCDGGAFVVDVGREKWVDGVATGSAGHTGLAVTVTTCEPFCLSFTVPADSICGDDTEYCIADSDPSACCVPVPPPPPPPPACCADADQPEELCLAITSTGTTTFPLSTVVELSRLLSNYWISDDTYDFCTSGVNTWELFCEEGVWTVRGPDDRYFNNIVLVSASCSPFEVVFNAVYNCVDVLAITLTFTEKTGACDQPPVGCETYVAGGVTLTRTGPTSWFGEDGMLLDYNLTTDGLGNWTLVQESGPCTYTTSAWDGTGTRNFVGACDPAYPVSCGS